MANNTFKDTDFNGAVTISGAVEMGVDPLIAAHPIADELVVGGTTEAGITLSSTSRCTIAAMDAANDLAGRINYLHASDEWAIFAGLKHTWYIAGALKMTFDTAGLLSLLPGTFTDITASGSYIANATAASAPGTPSTGWMYMDTALNELRFYNGTEWQSAAGSTAAEGQLYTDNLAGSADAITISTQDVYVQYTAFITASDDGTLVTASTSTDDLTVEANGAGTYEIVYEISMDAASNNQDIDTAIFVNGSVSPSTKKRRRHNTGTDVGVSTGGGFVTLAESDTVDFRIANHTSTANLGVWALNLRMRRIKE